MFQAEPLGVFLLGEGGLFHNPFWQLVACRKEMPADVERVRFTPVAKGPGWAMFDKVRVTVFEGSDYVAEAHRAKTPPRIDGSLDDWVKQCN
jgi:hypothetical protein